MTPTSEETGKLLHLIYGAAADAHEWPAALRAIAQALDAEHACFETPPTGAATAGVGRSAAGAVRIEVDGQRGSAKTLRASLVADDGATALVVVRPAGRGPFSRTDHALCETLLLHLVRARRLEQRVCTLEAGQAAVVEVLDRLPLAVLLLTPEAHVLQLNRSAESIIQQCDGLTIVNGRLVATRPASATALRRLIASSEVGGVLAIARPSCARPLSVVIAPLGTFARSPQHPATPVTAVFVSDPDLQLQSLDGLLAPLYGLTPTESAVVEFLVQGARVETIAHRLDVSLNTVRTHLKRVYAKTGATGQSSLMRLLLLGPALLRFEPPAAGTRAA